MRAYDAAPAFVPAFAAMTGTAELLAAAMLFGVFRVDGSRAVLAAAIAYLFDAFLIVPYALTFPGVIDAHGFVGNEESAVWLWILWHLAFPVIIVAGTLRRTTERRDDARYRDIAGSIAGVSVAALFTAYMVIGQKDALPILVRSGQFTPGFSALSLLVSVITAIAAVTLIASERVPSKMRLWIVVALAASTLDTALNAISPTRYSFAWYVGKTETLVTATVVLLSFLASWSSMYAQLNGLTARLKRSLAERRTLEDTLQRERHVSMTLQAAALPTALPVFDHVVLSAAYHPGSAEATIGGDWYDAFTLADGRVVISIGDVMGSGIHAAVTMSKLRQAMQAAAMIHADPVAMLQVADWTLRLHDPDGYATALAMVYDHRSQQATFATAGHLSPLLRHPDGRVSEHDASGTMLGVATNSPRVAATIDTPAGGIIMLYTDGIIELTHDVLEGQKVLMETLSGADVSASTEPAKLIVDRVLAGRQPTDDIAVLTISLAETPVASPPTDDVLTVPFPIELRSLISLLMP